MIFFQAKNGEKTCSENDVHLHSCYNPSREAERFVLSIECSFLPKAIFVIEPALSYCQKFLKKRFPNAKIFAIRVTHDFRDFDFLFDQVFYQENLSEFFLISELGEEILCSAIFAFWPPSKSAFPYETLKIIRVLKSAIFKSQSILKTRSFFCERWILNIVKNCKNLLKAKIVKIKSEKSDFPVVIAASAPSLEECFDVLKKNRDSFFLIALSSALKPLVAQNIFPDLCITSDGGFFAKRHIDFLGQKQKIQKIPLAFPIEGAVPFKSFLNQKILPLSYKTKIEKNLYAAFFKQDFFMLAEQNGSVSGTALEFAKSITNGKIFFFGLDLKSSHGMQHARENALSIFSAKNDFRLSPCELRVCRQKFLSENSLLVYRAWFSELKNEKTKNVFRIFKNKNSLPLGEIKTEDFSFFEKNILKTKKKSIIIEENRENFTENLQTPNFTKNQKIDVEKILQILKKTLKTEEKTIFAFENVMFEKEKLCKKKLEWQKKIQEKKQKILYRAKRILKNDSL